MKGKNDMLSNKGVPIIDYKIQIKKILRGKKQLEGKV